MPTLALEDLKSATKYVLGGDQQYNTKIVKFHTNKTRPYTGCLKKSAT